MGRIKQQQIRKNSGTNFDFNLDDITCTCLSSCSKIYKERDEHFSNAVIVRHAVRRLLEHLRSLHGEDAFVGELVEIKRAAKGC